MDELERLQAEVARLREWSRIWKVAAKTWRRHWHTSWDNYTDMQFISADDWLAAHDAEIRLHRDKAWIRRIIRSVTKCGGFTKDCAALGIRPLTIREEAE